MRPKLGLSEGFSSSRAFRLSSRVVTVALLIAALMIFTIDSVAIFPFQEKPDAIARPPNRPDVLLISIDTTRSDYLTFLDHATAPNLTEAARNGTIFQPAISGSSWTLPAHVQMFTGMANKKKPRSTS